MSNTNKNSFTQEELAVIKTYSVNQSSVKLLMFYSCVLFAPVLFALYGLVNNDAVAVFIAVGGLALFIIWHISASMKNERTFNAIFQKILDQNNSE